VATALQIINIFEDSSIPFSVVHHILDIQKSWIRPPDHSIRSKILHVYCVF